MSLMHTRVIFCFLVGHNIKSPYDEKVTSKNYYLVSSEASQLNVKYTICVLNA